MTERKITSDEEATILDLYEQITATIPGIKSEIRAITYEGFKVAVDQMMKIADLKGKLEALDVSIKTIGSTKRVEI